ncbi:hypothetical protein AB0E01_25900 [Nocardia vinacea]
MIDREKHPYTGEMTPEEIVELLGNFGMIVPLDDGDREMQKVQV